MPPMGVVPINDTNYIQSRASEKPIMPSPPPPPPTRSSPSGQGAVDRLTTFFLGKFQEARKTSELAALQCATQLKFEAAEKQLDDHTAKIAGLRSEVQSFWDKAPSFFLHKFSAQLDSLSAARSEKGEQALSRLEHKVDDEVRNLGDQVAGLSTKLAVSTAATSASVDDLARKVDLERDSASESLRRCENDVRSRMTRLESVIETNKTEAAIEHDKLNKTSQEAGRRLQSKIDSLELTVMRQSEELTGQCSKIERMEMELQKLLQMSLHQEKTHASMAKMLSAQGDELSKLSEQALRPRTPIRQSPRAVHYPSSRGYLASTLASGSLLPSEDTTAPLHERPEMNMGNLPGARNQALKANSFTQYQEPGVVPQMEGSRKRAHENDQHESALEVKAPPKVSEPPTKRLRPRSNQDAPVHITSDDEGTPARTTRTPPQRAQSGGPSQRNAPRTRSTPTARNTPPETRKATPRARKQATKEAVEAVEEVEPPESISDQDDTLGKTEDVIFKDNKPTPRGSLKTLRTTRTPAKQKTKATPKAKRDAQARKPTPSQPVHPESDPQEPSDTAANPPGSFKAAKDAETTDTQGQGGDHAATQPSRTAAERREKTLAFMRHVRTCAVEYKCAPPRSERQFIWQFIEGIPDADWSTFFQKKLLDMFPSAVRPSLGVRAKHRINFDAGLTWRHVLEVIRSLQAPGAGRERSSS